MCVCVCVCVCVYLYVCACVLGVFAPKRVCMRGLVRVSVRVVCVRVGVRAGLCASVCVRVRSVSACGCLRLWMWFSVLIRALQRVCSSSSAT